MGKEIPRLVIAGLSGDSGKTIVSLSLLSALRQRELSISVFKKGPDYIDSAWLASVSQAVCRNLDTYMVAPETVLDTFLSCASESDIAIIEGNRGLFDGRDTAGTHSTAELAKLLRAPVVLVVNVTKATRTIAAVIKGCQSFDPDLNVVGVILNRVAGERHKRILVDAVESFCGLPVLGTLPKLGDDASLIPGRHLGLVTPAEFGHVAELDGSLRSLADKYLDTERLLALARSAASLPVPKSSPQKRARTTVRIAYFRDSVFTFYYPENLEALQAEGAELVPVSSLNDTALPDADALYIGGGFPETHAEKLSRNRPLMDSLKRAAQSGLPIYAECGGLIYLSRSLKFDDTRYPMAGVFPVDLAMHRKPVGHGYVQVRVDRQNPFFEVGATIRGHEFHYSGPVSTCDELPSCLDVELGAGLGNGRDGLLYKRTLACYVHIHARGVQSWASSMVSSAMRYKMDSGQDRFNKVTGTNRSDIDNRKVRPGNLIEDILEPTSSA